MPTLRASSTPVLIHPPYSTRGDLTHAQHTQGFLDTLCAANTFTGPDPLGALLVTDTYGTTHPDTATPQSIVRDLQSEVSRLAAVIEECTRGHSTTHGRLRRQAKHGQLFAVTGRSYADAFDDTLTQGDLAAAREFCQQNIALTLEASRHLDGRQHITLFEAVNTTEDITAIIDSHVQAYRDGRLYSPAVHISLRPDPDGRIRNGLHVAEVLKKFPQPWVTWGLNCSTPDSLRSTLSAIPVHQRHRLLSAHPNASNCTDSAAIDETEANTQTEAVCDLTTCSIGQLLRTFDQFEVSHRGICCGATPALYTDLITQQAAAVIAEQIEEANETRRWYEKKYQSPSTTSNFFA